MNPARLCFRGVMIPTILLASLISTGLAQSTTRQIGTQFEVTADPLVLRPQVKPCVVQLFSDYQFALFSETSQTFQFTPPAHCSGPWKKVVLEINFSENGGRQFDRTTSMYVANTNIYFGTTPEPLASLTNTWHVERDITDYSALLNMPQTGTMVLQNCTTDCPPPYNTLLTGVFTVNADLEFYPADQGGQGWHQNDKNSDVPDVVLPLEQTERQRRNQPAGFLVFANGPVLHYIHLTHQYRTHLHGCHLSEPIR